MVLPLSGENLLVPGDAGDSPAGLSPNAMPDVSMLQPQRGPARLFKVGVGTEPAGPPAANEAPAVIPFVTVAAEDRRGVEVRRLEVSDSSLRLFANRALLGQKVRVVFNLPEGALFDCVLRVLWTYPAEGGLVENGGGFLSVKAPPKKRSQRQRGRGAHKQGCKEGPQPDAHCVSKRGGRQRLTDPGPAAHRQGVTMPELDLDERETRVRGLEACKVALTEAQRDEAAALQAALVGAAQGDRARRRRALALSFRLAALLRGTQADNR
jgi:hypothetical protein